MDKTPGLDAAIVSLRDSREKIRKTNVIISTVEVWFCQLSAQYPAYTLRSTVNNRFA